MTHRALLQLSENLLRNARRPEDLAARRTASGPWKEIIDEVFPVMDLVTLTGIPTRRLHFPLNSHAPDCWLTDTGGRKLGIEVTVALGRARHITMMRLNRDGSGSGYVNIQDDATRRAIRSAAEVPGQCLRGDDNRSRIETGIRVAIARKSGNRFAGMALIVVVPGADLHPTDYPEIARRLEPDLASAPFSQVWLLDCVEHWALQIGVPAGRGFRDDSAHPRR